MAKRSTPKKRQPRSASSRRHKTFQNKARKKLIGMSDSMRKLDKLGKLKKTQKKSSDHVTKVKA